MEVPTAMGRPKAVLVLDAELREQLETLVNSRSLPAGLVRRAKIILLSASGKTNREIARQPETRSLRTAHRTNRAIQRKFTKKHHAVQQLAKKLSLAADQPERHRQVESPTFFAQIGRCQVNRDALSVRELISTIARRRFDAFATLFHRIGGETYDLEVLHARRAHIDFHFHRMRINSIHRRADF